ncbi:EutP/PduV family microcompartment system protein [Clostridium sp. P21]|uniref:EutP/PduV family microcompartment system protein n=1 Tax=Clostridium muellerianum TaxID=2716538 RepID=A0A7Y0EHY5_9CLOT|nr:EutP/PduV family microcompartment system protein [Clostridium muellerianum]NMM63808.1 EutP/PduV family microcompartment system protein [Clostridium muellerianum]
MKTLLLIGRTGSGKTTLTQVLNKECVQYKKTQAIEVCENIIDTPGEYIENRAYYKALIVSSVEADIIAFVQDCTEEESLFPPEFAGAFEKTVIGIITKIDLCKCEDSIKRAQKLLEIAGAKKIFKVSSTESSGIDEIKKCIH